MGANFNAVTFQDGPRELIEKTWRQRVEDSLFESGHSYSGEIGMLGRIIAKWEDKRFPTLHAAEQWLDETHQKWDAAIAVSYIGPAKQKFWLIGGWCSS